jgi:hypothetical protein
VGRLPSEEAREAVALLRRRLAEAESLGGLGDFLAYREKDI